MAGQTLVVRARVLEVEMVCRVCGWQLLMPLPVALAGDWFGAHLQPRITSLVVSIDHGPPQTWRLRR